MPDPAVMARRLTLDDLAGLELPQTPVISADGTTIVYVLRRADAVTDIDVTELWTVQAAGGEPRPLTRSGHDSAPAFSPDGSQLAFLRDTDGVAQVWLTRVPGGDPRRLSDLPGGAGAPQWSPDGTRIAFTAPVGVGAPGGGTGPGVPALVERLDHKLDGRGRLGSRRWHVHVVEVATGAAIRLTDGDWHADGSVLGKQPGPVWSPDGTKLAFTAAMDPDSDLTLTSSAYVVDAGPVTSGLRPVPRRVGAVDGRASSLIWSADGSALVVRGRTSTLIGHDHLMRVPIDGGPAVDLTAPLDRSVEFGGPQRTADGRSAVFGVRAQGRIELWSVDIDGASAPARFGAGGPLVPMEFDLASASSRTALIVADGRRFAEVAVLDPEDGRVTVLTEHTRRGIGDADPLPLVERWFEISDGTTVQGYLLADPDVDGPRPLLLDIHGGPHMTWLPTADPVRIYHQVLAANGWVVLMVNPRGSDGFGEAFYTAAVGDYGYGDEADLLEPIDQLVAEGMVDADRLAVTGYSYGGFMTMHLSTRTHRFRAAVAAGGFCDLRSMGGTAELGHYLTAWEDRPDPLPPGARGMAAPLDHVGDVSTPTLLLHAVDDHSCPLGQSEQWFTALRVRRVPTGLVVYPGAHGFLWEGGRPSDRRDYNQRVLDWLDRHVQPAG